MNKIRLTAITTSLLISVALSLPSPAVAAPTPGGLERCPVGYICLFENSNGTGRFWHFASGSKNLKKQHFNDQASFIWNRSSLDFELFNSLYCRDWGGYLTVHPGGWDNLALAFDGDWNDRISSLCVVD